MKKGTLIISASLLTIAMLIVYYQLNPEAIDIFPKCPFLALTGYRCPGCGTQRALHQLLHGNIIQAARYNLLFILTLPYLLLGLYLNYGKGLYKNRKYSELHEKLLRKLYNNKALWAILIIYLGFWVLRNVFPNYL